MSSPSTSTTRPQRLRAVFVALAAICFLGACGAATTSTVDAAPSTTPAELPGAPAVPSGREALLAAQGQPHVLWFWGAN